MSKFVVARNSRFSPNLLFGRQCEENPLHWARGRATSHKLERYALYHGVRALGLGEKDPVLVPEFHCPVMVEALLAAGTEVVYYRVTAKGEVDLEDVEERKEGLGGRATALLVTHYFGLPQRIPELREWCDRHGLYLIEDCTHGLLGRFQGRPLGSWGDVSVFSVCKTLPTPDGGLMVLNGSDRSYGFRARGQGPATLAKGAVRCCILGRGAPGKGFLPEEVDVGMHPLSGRILACADTEKVVGLRRRNYACLADRLGSEPDGLFVPEFPELPEGACPFLFPVRVTRGDVRKVHETLVERGIPISVYPDHLHPSLPREDFPLAYELAESLLCLPCHQDLSVRGLDKMLGILGAVASEL